MAKSSGSRKPRFQYDRSADSKLPPNFGNESPEYSIGIRSIPAIVSRQAIINFANQFGELAMEPHITPSDERLRKAAYVTFKTKSAFELCMNSQRRQSITIDGYPVTIQRWMPTGILFERTNRLLIFVQANSSECTLDEKEVRNYFQMNYGPVKAFSWKLTNVATVDFEDYDLVDRIIMTSLIHTINGITIRLEKMRSSNQRQAYENTVAPNEIKFCVHVKSIPSHVSGEQLANLFGSRVWDVLIRTGKNENVDPFEAWILKLNSIAEAQQLAESVTTIDGINIECNVEPEPLNEWTLCSGNRDGWCKHGDSCIYRHVMCTHGDQCSNDQCPYSHSAQRNIIPNPRYRPAGPIEQQYRIKIDGLPYSMTAIELLTELKKQPINLLNSIETPDIPEGSTVRHFYLVRQAAEKLARRRIYEWHDYEIRANYVVKCQLEYDRVPMKRIPSSLTVNSNEYHQLRSLFTPLLPGIDAVIGMPSEWVWTNRRLGHAMSSVYLVYPTDANDERLGAMKIYHHPNDLEIKRARRAFQALELLKNNVSIVSMYQSNVMDTTRKKDVPIWIITQLVSDTNLKNYIDQHKSEITFREALSLTRQLLDTVRQCHKIGVIHRNLEPNNIIVRNAQSQTSIEEVKLILIDFDLSWINSQELQINYEDDVRTIQYEIERRSINPTNQTVNHVLSQLTHYLSSNSLLNTPTLDSTGVCNILYWLFCGEWFDQMSTTNFSYETSTFQQNIQKEIGHIHGIAQVNEQLKCIFSRAFGPVNGRWHIEELVDHFEMIENALNELEKAYVNAFFPLTSDVSALPLNDPYPRIVTMLARIKQQFTQQYSTVVKWSHDKNRWSIKSQEKEVKNTDELIYDHQKQHCVISVICITKLEHDQTSLFLTNNAMLSTSSLKPICKLDSESIDIDNFSEHYTRAMKKLIVDWLNQTDIWQQQHYGVDNQ